MQPSIGYRQSGTIPLLLAITVALAVGCSDSTGPTRPSVQVSIATTGADLDPDGYVLVIDSTTTRPVGVNETIVVRDVPVGTHNVWLKGIAPNCVINFQGPPVSVWRGDGGSPSVVFTVSCVTRSIPVALASTQLLFVRDGRIYRTKADGTGLVALDSGETPTWSPDGQRIGFARGGNLYVMNADGANVQRVGGVPGTYSYAPTWSPDGRQVAFVSGGDDEAPSQITVVSLDAASPPVTIPDSWAPAWSPDGSRIAFVAWGSAGGTAVWTIEPDGSNPTKLTNYSGWWGDLAWSPDGKQIALSAVGDGLAVMNADGTGLRVLTKLPASRPAWSPDGQAIAFTLSDACNEGCTRRVFYVTADGSTTGLLIENGDSPSWHK